MARKKIHININTRILLYFLFVTILPLAILALTSTFIINSGLNEKSEQELLTKLESLQALYQKVFTNYKNIKNTDSFNELTLMLKEKNLNKVEKVLEKIKQANNLDYIVLYKTGNNIELRESDRIISLVNNKVLILYPVEDFRSSIDNMFTMASRGNQPFGTEVLCKNQIKFLGLNNKLVLKKEFENQNTDNFGLLSQMVVIPVIEKKIEETLQELNTPDNNTEEKQAETTEKESHSDIKLLGYLVVGSFINSNEDLSYILKDIPDVPVNIVLSNTLISTNTNIPFDVSSLELSKTKKIISEQSYRGEQFINNQWFRVASEPIKNFNGDTVALMIVGLKEDIFRSLKAKNSLLMLHVSLLVAAGGLILAFLFAKNITTPISRMIEAVKSIQSGNMHFTLEIPREDELGELALSINEMAQALDSRKNEILEYNRILLDQKTKLESIFNFSADGIMTLDKDRKITSVNPLICKWINEKEENITGKYYYEIINYNTGTAKPDNNLTIKNIDDITRMNRYYQSAKIADIDLEISYSPIIVEDNIISYVLILRDITERKETEELRENFIATLTHDLRVPLLAGVHTLEYLLKGSYGELDEKQKYIVEQLINSNKDLLRMVNTLLDTYSYESGKQTLVKREINMNKLIKESINELISLAEDKNHNIIFEETPEPWMVTGDKQELKRVLINLLSNAIIHTSEKGLIEFNLKPEGDFLIVSIKDNGAGLSEKDKKALFQRYFRGGKTLRKVGTGLGLYLSKYIVEAHGGKIWVESKIKEGSTFYFSIPLSKKGLEVARNDKT
jgi:PAS domain S-box-containing protein